MNSVCQTARTPASARHEAGDHDRAELDGGDPVAQAAHPALALAHAAQREPEWRARDVAQHERPDDEGRGADEVEAPALGDERGPVDIGQPVLAAGDARELEGEPEDHHAEREGDHEEDDAAAAHRHERVDGAHDEGHDEREPELDDDVMAAHGRVGDPVGGRGRDAGLAHRHEPGLAREEVHARGEEARR